MSNIQFQSFKKVAWLDGQFLVPQHFQQQERYIEQRIENRSSVIKPYVWGFSKLVIDQSLLLKGKIGLTYAEGIMPDGTPFSLPGMAPLPKPVDIPRDAYQLDVYLSLPLYQPGSLVLGAEGFEDREVRYRQTEIHVYDDSDTSKGTERLESAEQSFSIKFDTSERGGFDCIAFCRVAELTKSGTALLCDDFIAPCYAVGCSEKLALYLTSTINIIGMHATILSDRIVAIQESGMPLSNSAMMDIRLLELLNGAEALFMHWHSLRDVHPETFYQQLVQLNAQISSYTLERRSHYKPNYIHTDLAQTIPPVIQSIRERLDSLLKQTAVPISFDLYDGGIRLAEITQQDLLSHGRFIIGVHCTGVPQKSLKQAILEKTKICERDDMVRMISAGLGGVVLQPLDYPPQDIHPQPGWLYFELKTSGPEWSAIQKTGFLALSISGYQALPDLSVSLYGLYSR